MSTKVSPIDPIAPYLGGKRLLADRVIARLSPIPHRIYAEPFIGMGGVFFRRSSTAPVEVMNDINRDVATLFRVARHHKDELLRSLAYMVTSRDEFDRLKSTPPETLTDVHRAARFLYLQRAAFGGQVKSQSFGVSLTSAGARFDLEKLIPHIDAMHTRLSSVMVECLPYGDFIDRYDRSETLFYLDPPYWGGEEDYGKGVFERADYQRMAIQLADLKGKFILSINDVPDIRDVFSAFHIEAVEVTYSIGTVREDRQKAKELFISNVEPGAGMLL